MNYLMLTAIILFNDSINIITQIDTQNIYSYSKKKKKKK